MAAYSTKQAIHLLMDSNFEELDSGGEGDIEEDPAFPLPHSQESEESEGEGMINHHHQSDWLAQDLELEPRKPGRCAQTYFSFPSSAHFRTRMRIRGKIWLARETTSVPGFPVPCASQLSACGNIQSQLGPNIQRESQTDRLTDRPTDYNNPSLRMHAQLKG